MVDLIPPAVPSSRFRSWVRAHLPELLFALLLLAVLPMRDLWSPDEPDFAQCVKEMRLRGDWLLPYLNGVPYNEKPILYYWVMKLSAMGMDALTGGLGFTQGVAAWALRLPSVVAAVVFLSGFRRWATRFMPGPRAEWAALILATTPIWFWQSQYIQIDLLFSALVAWSWLCWLAGYLLLREQAVVMHPTESGRWFLKAYFWMALAFLAKGPLAMVLSGALVLGYLGWQRDWKALKALRFGPGFLLFLVLVAPWYVVASLKNGPAYAYAMIIHQNFERALHAWDHIQPWWRYAEYIAHDAFPWVLLLPFLAFQVVRNRHRQSALDRFLLLAFAGPFLLLSLSQSKQGKYVLMAYPFLALLLGGMFQSWQEVSDRGRIRRAGYLLLTGLGLVALTLIAVVGFHAGGRSLQSQLGLYRPLIWALVAVVSVGMFALVLRIRTGEAGSVLRAAALTLGLVYLLIGTWGFHLLDAQKGPQVWTRTVQPAIQGRKTWFWGEIRSAAMIYTDQLMPEIWAASGLEQVRAEDRLVVIASRWEPGYRGLRREDQDRFEVILTVPMGGDQWLLLRRRPQ